VLEINRILIQLNKAIESANSNFPQEKGLAVTLFDNLIEVQLFKRAETAFLWDSPTWYNDKRFFNSKTRKSTLGYYDTLLKFSKNNKIISESDFEILKYAHSIRNSVYHQGDLDDLKLDLAILIYYDFFKRNILSWGSPNSFVCFTNLPGYEKIDFGNNLKDEKLLPDYENYFEENVNLILNKVKLRSIINDKVKDILSKQIARIKRAIDFIKAESKNLNFYNVLERFSYLNDDFYSYRNSGRKPKNLDSILLLYAFIRENKDYLEDIADFTRRQTEGKKLLKKYRALHKGKYPNWTNIDKIEIRIKKLDGQNPDKVLKNLIDIENKIAYLYSDLVEAASDLDGYIQYLIDIEKGK